jgi:hypothetical protein
MKASTHTTRRLRRLLIPPLAFAAIAVPAAPAGIPPGRDAVSSEPVSKGENYYAAGRNAVSSEPVIKGENYYAPGLSAQSPAAAAAISTSTGFQWGDAGIGAGGALAFVLVGGGMLVLRRHRGHPSIS